jgi:predicted MPP superfamily phosphohydrolase
MEARRKTAAELCVRLPGSGKKPIVVLDHQPTQFAEIEAAGADLVLCGHTHKGQFFPGNLMTKQIYKKLGAHYGYWQGNSLQAVVTSGAGYWGPPVRIGTNSDVAVIDVNFVE